jgi:Flp pilus assembly protein TadG
MRRACLPVVQPTQRRGSILMLTALCLTVIMAFMAFAIDYGYIVVADSDLQNSADAGALSGARALKDGRNAAISAAKTWAGRNRAAGESVLVTDEDVEIGLWNSDTATFTVVPVKSSAAANAVRVTCRRTLNLFFGPVIGTRSADLRVTAIALRPSTVGTRFLIDNEMIDSGIQSIKNLESSTGKSVDKLLKARGLNDGRSYGSSGWTWADNFLDLPTGAQITLPTGQGTDYGNNDAGLFDINHPEFAFKEQSSFMSFLKYSETGNDSSKWGTDNSTIKANLDPLKGVSPVTNSSSYSSFVSPDFIHVSPVFSSDINTLSMQNGVPQVNALGLRCGLIAYKIIAVGPDVDGNGSVLPKLVIEIVDPATINPNDVKPVAGSGGGGTSKLVR